MRILDVDQVTPGQAGDLSAHLLPSEIVHAAFSSPTGAILFTGSRIIIVQREHLLEERVETSSFPYREVRHFSIQEGVEARSAIRIWLGTEPQPLHLRANPGTDFSSLQALLAQSLG
jgi:hypothetical protein